ncbi:MAG: RNA methyltransferase [Hyphomonadaceae bacterium]|nr:RNA methyltransferase [Hyphomonadaceae bacterium]
MRANADPNGPMWLWGTHAALAALANPARRIDRVLATRNAATHLPPGIADQKAFQLLQPDAIDSALPPGAVHQGLAVRAWPLEPKALDEACAPADTRPVVVLDGVTDPQNVGAIFRSAAAFHARALVMQDRKSPPLTGALAKAAAGAVELVPEVRVVNVSRALNELSEMGYLTVGLVGDADLTLAHELADARPAAIALGAEGKGLRDGVRAACERVARILINPAMESLNVSNAAAIALYEASRSKA